MNYILPKSCACAVATLLCAAPAAAESGQIDLTSCRAGTTEVLFHSEALTVMRLDHKGIHRSNNADKATDGASDWCMGLITLSEQGRRGSGYCVNLHLDGERTVVNWTATGEGGTWEFVAGTGNWAGVKGSGSYEPLLDARPVTEGTYQGCIRIIGNYETAR